MEEKLPGEIQALRVVLNLQLGERKKVGGGGGSGGVLGEKLPFHLGGLINCDLWKVLISNPLHFIL